MAKAKKKAKKTTRRKVSMAPKIVVVPPGVGQARREDFFSDVVPPAPRKLSLPELWCKIENPVAVRFLESMRADASPEVPGGRKRPAMLARIIDVGDGEKEKDLALPAPLASVFASVPAGGYVGRTYRITRHRRHERKNAAGYTVEEITV